MEPLLRVQDLTVSYASARRSTVIAVDGVSFEIARGETVGLLGESGCGKTTLALSILRLLPSSAQILRGSVVFANNDVFALRPGQLQRIRGAQIGMVHQEPALALNPVLRVGEQIEEVLRAHTTLSHKDRRLEVERLLLQMGFDAKSRIGEAYPHQLSGGQRQRISITQAISCRPSLLVADEPTTALDTDTQSDILSLLARLRRELNLAVMLISHDPEVLLSFCDRILVLYSGRIVEDGPAKEIFSDPMHPYTRALLSCRPATDSVGVGRRQPWRTVPGEPGSAAMGGCVFEPRCCDRMTMCPSQLPNYTHVGKNRRVACFKYVP